jgi:hypothetical protein
MPAFVVSVIKKGVTVRAIADVWPSDQAAIDAGREALQQYGEQLATVHRSEGKKSVLIAQLRADELA